MFRWAESKEMVPKGTFHNLSTLEPLKAGRTLAPETARVRPVCWQDVTSTVQHLSPQVAAMVLLQWESAMRPGEVVRMRACDIDRTDRGMWIYEPEQHKNKHRGKERPIPLFARSQGHLRPFLEDIEIAKDSTRFLFAPEGHAARHDCYSTTHYAQAIRRGIAAANAPARQDAILRAILPIVPHTARARLEKAVRRLVTYFEHDRIARAIERQAVYFGFDAQPVLAAAQSATEAHEDTVAEWSPNQLRHAAATRIERQLSVEDARIVLGHSSSKMTRRYVDPDVKRAYESLRKLG
jgi:integrase